MNFLSFSLFYLKIEFRIERRRRKEEREREKIKKRKKGERGRKKRERKGESSFEQILNSFVKDCKSNWLQYFRHQLVWQSIKLLSLFLSFFLSSLSLPHSLLWWTSVVWCHLTAFFPESEEERQTKRSREKRERKRKKIYKEEEVSRKWEFSSISFNLSLFHPPTQNRLVYFFLELVSSKKERQSLRRERKKEKGAKCETLTYILRREQLHNYDKRHTTKSEWKGNKVDRWLKEWGETELSLSFSPSLYLHILFFLSPSFLYLGETWRKKKRKKYRENRFIPSKKSWQ